MSGLSASKPCHHPWNSDRLLVDETRARKTIASTSRPEGHEASAGFGACVDLGSRQASKFMGRGGDGSMGPVCGLLTIGFGGQRMRMKQKTRKEKMSGLLPLCPSAGPSLCETGACSRDSREEKPRLLLHPKVKRSERVDPCVGFDLGSLCYTEFH
jgi:hypothetical protein